MPLAAAEHGVKPQPYEQGDHGKQDNLDGHANFSNNSSPYIGAPRPCFKWRAPGGYVARARRSCYPALAR
jgi:hypothetical protein